ncbi:Protein of unknown function [Gryllus bimaculatus]|nr:Protein of unknown function [Gryllus bimaculatus]
MDAIIIHLQMDLVETVVSVADHYSGNISVAESTVVARCCSSFPGPVCSCPLLRHSSALLFPSTHRSSQPHPTVRRLGAAPSFTPPQSPPPRAAAPPAPPAVRAAAAPAAAAPRCRRAAANRRC